MKLAKFFDQYLRTTQIPNLEYKIQDGQLQYRFNNCVKGFTMKIRTMVDNKKKWLEPTTEWQSIKLKNANAEFKVDRDFYITTKKVTE